MSISEPLSLLGLPEQRASVRTIHLEAPVHCETFRYDVAVLGLGYVGLPTALAFGAAGQDVLGIDISEQRLDAIRGGRVDLLDSDFKRLWDALQGGCLPLVSDVGRLAEARTVLICVPTPVDEHLVPDLTILRAACASVVANAVPGQVLILTSTTYVGSTDDLLLRPLADRGLVAGRDVFVAFSPERIDPGNSRHAHEDVPRVIGGVTPVCSMRALEALSGYTAALHVVSSPGAAEMTKLVENTFRAVNVALANEFADVCRELGLDVREVLAAAATKPYGFMAFNPGPGVGGHCIPCDPHYLLWQLRQRKVASPIIEQAMQRIALRPMQVVERVRTLLGDDGRALRGARVVVVGVAYKPDVEDVRESPALEILERLREAGADVSYHDPLVPQVTLRGGACLSSSKVPSDEAPDLVLVHTAHSCVPLEWIQAQRLVLDATYSLDDVPDGAVL